MKSVCNAQGYDLIVCSGKQSHRMLPERMIDGAIILDHTFASEELMQYADRGHKIVVLDREMDHPNINQVLLDNKAGATLAMELIEQGHKKIYVVTGPEGSFDSVQRLKAVRQVAEREADVEWIEITGDFEKSSGEQAAEQIVQVYDGPAAVFCLNDEMAIGLCDRLADSALGVGQEIDVIGFDNIELSRYVQPRLASIDYSKRKWGLLAAEQLIKIIAGEPVDHERIYVTLVEGGSVSALFRLRFRLYPCGMTGRLAIDPEYSKRQGLEESNHSFKPCLFYFEDEAIKRKSLSGERLGLYKPFVLSLL